MALYIGRSKRKIKTSDGTTHLLNVPLTSSTVSKIRLLSSEGYILKDKNEIYLVPKEVE